MEAAPLPSPNFNLRLTARNGYLDNEFHHFVDTSILISNTNSFACPSSYCDTA